MGCVRGWFLGVFILLVEAKHSSGRISLVCVVNFEVTIDLGSFAGALI